ncbi:MAG: hypothetical protein QME48_08880 [bacterium]|nr:hypothetical protein [bacterium]
MLKFTSRENETLIRICRKDLRISFLTLGSLFGLVSLIGLLVFFLSFENVIFFVGFCLTGILAVIIVRHAYLKDNKRMLWNPLLFLGGYTFVADGIPALLSFLSLWDYLPIANAEIQTRVLSIFIAIISLLSFWLGYWISNKFFTFKTKQLCRNSNLIIEEKPDMFYLFILIVIYALVLWGRYELVYKMGVYLGSGIGGKPVYLQASLGFFDFSGCFLMALMGYYYLGNKKKMWFIVALLIALTDIWFAILIAQKERLLTLILAITFCWAFYQKKYNSKRQLLIGFSFIIITIIIILSTGPLFLTLRSPFISYEIRKNPVSIIDNFKENLSLEAYNISLQYIFKRVDETYVVSSALETFPSIIPYQYGKTYLQGIICSIPFGRKDDIPVTQPNEWGRALGLSEPFDYITGTKVPWFMEGYVNFGILGVIGSSFIVGLLTTLLWQYFKSKISLSTGLVFYALYYDLLILHTHNGFMYIFKNLIMWAFPIFIVVMLIKHRSWMSKYRNKYI